MNNAIRSLNKAFGRIIISDPGNIHDLFSLKKEVEELLDCLVSSQRISGNHDLIACRQLLQEIKQAGGWL